MHPSAPEHYFTVRQTIRGPAVKNKVFLAFSILCALLFGVQAVPAQVQGAWTVAAGLWMLATMTPKSRWATQHSWPGVLSMASRF
jgi:hypothetical protein